MVKSFHSRMAELWVLNKQRSLTPDEMEEMQQVLHLNAMYCWEMAQLENLSLVASMIGDTKEQLAICAQIDDLERNPHFGPKKRKKTDRKGPPENP